MIDPLRTAAMRWPDVPAVRDAQGIRTWSRLLQDAAALAGAFTVPTGTRVALLAADTAAAAVAIHAIRLAGGVLVPLHRRLATSELADRLTRSRARVLLHDDRHTGVAAALGDATALEEVVDLGQPRKTPPSTEAATLDPDAPGAVVFTSGTTSVARGVVLSHGALLASATAWDTFLASGPADHWLSTLSMSHVAGLGMALRPLLTGALLTLHDRFEPDAVGRALEHDGITLASLVPTQLMRLLDAGPIRTTTLRALLLGGGPVPPGLVRRALDADLPIVTTYGLTEAASGVTALPVVEAPLAMGSAGRPLPGVRVRVVDAQAADVGPDVVGSILVGGPVLADGYDDDPTGSSATFVEGWLRTRDVGRLDVEGRLWVVDRQDELIISGGENISPAEVEGILAMHPGVADVAVVGRPDPEWGAVAVAAVVPRPDQPTPTLVGLRAFARDHVAGYKLPRDLRTVPTIPRTASGKVLRREVAALLAATPQTDAIADRPGATSHDLARPDGATIHVEDEGSGPCVVLLHATLSNARELRGLASTLAGSFRVLSVDRRTAGSSRMPPDDPGGAVDVGVHIGDLLGALEELVPGQRVLVVGHSFGGCVALELAARHPERVAAVWVFEPPYLASLADTRASDAETLGDRIAMLARDQGMAAAALAFLDAVRGPGTAARLPVAARERLGSEGRSAVADARLLGLDPGGLDRITAPVVLGLGDRSGGPYAAIADALSRRVPSLVVQRFPELGHGGPVSQPGGVAPSIIALAQRLGFADAPERTEGSR